MSSIHRFHPDLDPRPTKVSGESEEGRCRVGVEKRLEKEMVHPYDSGRPRFYPGFRGWGWAVHPHRVR